VSIEAEAVLHASSLAERAIVLRLAGLYGPNRIPRREDLVSGKSLAADPAAFLNLIHVDDAARIVVAVEAQARPPCAYLVSDGCPVVRGEYYAEAARLLGAPQPTFAEADKRSKPDTRGNTDKRINNSRLITEIEFQLQYPSYKQGLAASIGSF
jgi:nucleoside-diphosphate-sugar epimerase